MSKPTGKLIRVTTASIGAVPVERKVNNKPLSADISLSAGDVGAYNKTETDNKVADAKKAGTDAQTKANAASTAATNANNNANGRVPSGRKVNGKPLTTDITLSAGDVGTYDKPKLDQMIKAVGTKNTANKAANGWWKCGDTGIIYQWGFINESPADDYQITFPIAFPNVCTVVQMQIITSSTGELTRYPRLKIMPSKTGANVYHGGVRSGHFNWIAMGY